MSSKDYFKSLLQQAYEVGMLSDIQIEKIQYDCLELVAQIIESYKGGQSSSIREDDAQNILESTFFTIGLRLKEAMSPDEAIAMIIDEGLFELYKNGRECIDQLINSTKILHSSIIKNLFHTENDFYRSVIVDDIQVFFRCYYPDFGAQEIHIIADYPVHHLTEDLNGIEYIRQYLECIYYENLFCTRFSSEDVHNLLLGYSEIYEQLRFNIYEQVVSTAIGCILTGRDLYRLKMKNSSREVLKNLFRGKTRPEIEGILSEAADQLCIMMKLNEPLSNYIRESLPQIALSIEKAALQQNLDSVFLLPRYPEYNKKPIFSFGEKMSDEKYRMVLEEILQCRDFSEKKEIINNEVQSLADLEDILQDVIFNEEEILNILSELSPLEIAGLIKKNFMNFELNRYGGKGNQIVFCECIKKNFDSLPVSQQDRIKDLAGNLNFEYKGY